MRLCCLSAAYRCRSVLWRVGAEKGMASMRALKVSRRSRSRIGLVALSVAAVLVGGPGAVRSPVAGKPAGVPQRVTAGAPVAGPSKGRAARQGLGSLPVAARSAVSAALGAESPAFFAHRSGGGYRLSGGGVTADVDAGGAGLRAGGVSLSMTVAGVGRGVRLERPEVLSVAADANRVSLDRGGLTEWYAAGPLGIEQGFTLSHRLAGTTGPATLTLQLAGEVRARQAASGTVFLTRPGQPGLSYGALSATDASGQPLRSALQLHGGGLLIRVWDRGASYPLTIDPLIQQGSKLTASDEAGAGYVGDSVALSADGNTALIGGPDDNNRAGAAWVFTRSGSTWTQQGAKLTGGGESGAGRFGSSVALSADGNTALIGGWYDNSFVGAAWVFTRSGSTWTQQGPKLTDSAARGFGESVALSSDANTALIGSSADGTSNTGAAWVFTRSGSTWTQQGAKLTGGGGYGGTWCICFGHSVALSADGNTALIGGYGDGSGTGAAWVFTRSGSTWTQQGAKLAAGDDVGLIVQFGRSVALSADGDIALIGGPRDNGDVGAVWVFTRSGSIWTQQGAKLTASGAGYFGDSVALSADGNTALISELMAVRVFARSGSIWAQGAKLTGSGAAGLSGFGDSVALSADGNTALIGGPWDDSYVGAAWVFTSSATVPGAPTLTTAAGGNSSVSLGWSAPGSDGGSVVTGYKVYRGTAAGGETLLAAPAGTGTNYTDNAAVNGTTYFYKVSAVNAVGEGGFSNELSAVPAGSPTVPDAPSGLTATALSRSLIGLGWTDNAANETGFRIERSFDGSSGWRQVGSVAANATTYLHWRHWPLTTSYYRVRATNVAGHSTYSNVASATTLG